MRREKWVPPPENAIILAELPRDKKGRLVWMCSKCCISGFWGDGWIWWGSYLDTDNGFVRKVLCPKCAGDRGEGQKNRA